MSRERSICFPDKIEPQIPIEVTPIRRHNFDYVVNVTTQTVAAFLGEHPDIPQPNVPELGNEILQQSWVWIATGPIRARAAVCTELDNDDVIHLGVSSYLIENVVFDRIGSDDFSKGIQQADDSEKWNHTWVNREWKVEELREGGNAFDEFRFKLKSGLTSAFEDKAEADEVMVKHRKKLGKAA
jgi:hypothetical protein